MPTGEQMRSIRGGEIAMIFQEPMTSLQPLHTIGNQIMEAIRLHQDVGKQEAADRGHRHAGQVGIPKPERAHSTSIRTSSAAACASA